ncbi:MAG: Ig family protein [Bryobacterales bacterium]|nr:Ig family protein [Bryobacterales bacterium]
MDLSLMKSHGFRAFGVLLGLTMCAGTVQAANLLTATASVAVTCSTSSGPGVAANIVVKPVAALTGSATINVTVAAPGSGLTITNPVSQVLNAGNSSTGITYTVNTVNGCVGTSTGAVTVRFSASGVLDATTTVNDTVTATTSGLVASPVTVTCARSAGPVYTPGPAQTVSVTSTAAGGTPFTVDTTGTPPPAWLVVTPTTGGTAGSTPLTFTVAPAAGCGGFAAGSSTTATLHLVNAPAPDKLLAVTLQVVPPSLLVATPSPASLTYVKGSGTAGYVDVRVTSATTPAPFFSVSTASLPIWLTVDSTTGTVPKSIRFSTTSVCDTLAPGTYSATVYIKVSGSADLAVPISLLVNNKAPRLSVAEGTTRNISWTIGTALPTAFITAVSSDSPISYKATTGGSLGPIVPTAQQSGLAYSFGTQIGVSFNPLIFAAAQPGSVLTGTVTLTWGSPASTIVVTFNVSILSPGATVSGLSPASLPTAAPGQTFTVVLTGTGFVPSTDPSQKTKVGIMTGGALVVDTNIAANVVNPSNIILTITVPVVPDANLPFAPSGTGGAVVFGICNPAGTTCSLPSGTATLTIGSGPIIQAVTSASAFIQVAPPALPTISAYDMLSIFGANFCSSGGTGCSSSQILFGTPDATLRYATSLSPDAAGPTRRNLSVTFQTIRAHQP